MNIQFIAKVFTLLLISSSVFAANLSEDVKPAATSRSTATIAAPSKPAGSPIAEADNKKKTPQTLYHLLGGSNFVGYKDISLNFPEKHIARVVVNIDSSLINRVQRIDISLLAGLNHPDIQGENLRYDFGIKRSIKLDPTQNQTMLDIRMPTTISFTATETKQNPFTRKREPKALTVTELPVDILFVNILHAKPDKPERFCYEYFYKNRNTGKYTHLTPRTRGLPIDQYNAVKETRDSFYLISREVFNCAKYPRKGLREEPHMKVHFLPTEKVMPLKQQEDYQRKGISIQPVCIVYEASSY